MIPLELNHPVFGSLKRKTYASGVSDNWRRSLQGLHAASGWRMTRLHLYDGEFASLPAGYVLDSDLVIEDTQGMGPSVAQERAWTVFLENQDSIIAEVRLGLETLIKNAVGLERESLLEVTVSEFDHRINSSGIFGTGMIEQHSQLAEFFLSEKSKDGIAYLELHFLWSWSEEHRAVVVLNGTKRITEYVAQGVFLEDFV